jgi:acyl transferase domain-containing protein/thioesterase domain-containing protein
MTNFVSTLRDLIASNAQVWIEKGEIRFRIPKKNTHAIDKDALKKYRADLIEYIETFGFINSNASSHIIPGGHSARDAAIAIVGLSVRVPGGGDAAGYWRLLAEQRDAVVEIPRDRFDVDAWYDPDPDAAGKIYVRAAGLLDRVDLFDAGFFGIGAREAASMDPQQRLLLEAAWAALEDAGLAPERLRGSATGVFVGISTSDYAGSVRAHGAGGIDAYFGTGLALSVAAGRLAYALGLEGPTLSVDTACSSSLVAVHQACQALRAGECDAALAGGVNVILSQEIFAAFCQARMLSPDGRCKTFDAAADGYGRGEGVGVVVLKRLADAEREGDRILAVIRGSAVNQDGASGGLTVPNGPAQERVIGQALARAGVSPAEVAYLECHGTGTSLGDPIEVGAAARALGAGRPADRPLLLGSAKAAIGHLEAAAGIAGLIKVVLALRAGELPGQPNFGTPNPHIAWSDLPVEVVRSRRPWPAGRRLAGVSSFGFSGTNAHVVLEGYAEPAAEAAALPERGAHLLPLSAKSEAALAALAGRYLTALENDPDLALGDACFTAGVGRSHLPHRAAVVGGDRATLLAGLAALREGAGHPALRLGERRGAGPRVAVLFSGQGSQWAGMGAGLYGSEPVFRDVVDRCAAAVDGLGLHGRPLREVMFGTAAGLLEDTAYAQPALYALEAGLWALWRSWGLGAEAVLGHSLGELVAAHAAGVFGLEEGARLAARRGALMGALPAVGAMAAVFAPAARVAAALAGLNAGIAGPGLSLAAENGTHVVVSGPAGLVDRLVEDLAGAGVRSQRLAVSHAFHSGLLEPMLEALEAAAGEIAARPPALALIGNLTGAAFAAGTAPDGAYWRRQARERVRFAEGVSALARLGIELVVELGPRPVLAPLAAACWPSGVPAPVAVASLRPGVADDLALAETLASAYAAGAAVDFAAREAGRGRRRVALPGYPFARERHWVATPRIRRGMSAHPLLGEVHHAADGSVSWTQELRSDEPGWFGDHAVHGRVVAPAALHACLAAAAGGGAPVAVRALEILAPLVLPEDGGVTLQLLLGAAEAAGEGRAWRVFARPSDAAADAPWRLLARGTVEGARAAEPAPALAEPLIERDVAAFYAGFAALGIEYGPSFQGVVRVAGGAGVARGEIAAPDGVAGGATHPALLDACFQVLAAALPEGAATGDAVVPIGLEGLEVWRPAPARVVCEARLRGSPTAETATADLWLRDAATGAAFGRVAGLTLKRAPRAALLGGAEGADDLLYALAWREVACPAGAARFVPEPAALAAALAPRVAALAAAAGFAAVAEARLEALLERAARAHAAEALRRLGWAPRPGEVVEAAALRASLGVRAEHARLFARLLGLLGEAGLLTPAGAPDAWRVPAEGLRAAAEDPGAAAAAAGLDGAIPWVLLERCGAALAGVLRGEAAPLALLFPEDGRGAAELYRDAPAARLLNALLAEAVGRVVAALPPGRRLRVIEIGAGTGGATAAVLPLLPRGRSAYVYTDLSASFFAAAEARFGAGHPFVQYRVLDIEREPAAQGFAAGGYDLVIASNVLHATRDVAAAAAHCRRLLAPGGALLLLEGLARRGWLDLTFGLLEGWWRFADAPRRAEHALLDAAGWAEALAAAGFAASAVLEPVPEAGMGQGLVLARAAAAEAPGLWLLAADRGGTGERLAAALAARGQRVLLALPEDAALATEPAPGEAIERRRLAFGEAAAWRSLAGELGALRGVVHLAALDAAAVEDASGVEGAATTQRLAADAAAALGSALALAQGLIAAGAAPGAGLWLVSERAQPVAGEPGRRLAGASLWGFGRTLANEHPELGVRQLDLDGGAETEALLEELLAPDAETAVARRGTTRLVPRLVQARLASRLQATPIRAGVTYLVTGGLGGLGLAVAAWLAERGATHLALNGRRAPAPSAEAAIAALRARGVAVEVVQADVSRPAEIDRLLAVLDATMPPLAGVIHAAGLVRDGAVAHQDWGRFAEVLGPKMLGAWQLHRATLGRPLDLFVLFASAAGILGSPGQANHAAANTFLDALARHRRALGLPGLSLDWGAWSEIGEAAERRGAIEAGMAGAGIGWIAPAAGLAALERALGSDAAQLAAVVADWRRLARAQASLGPLLGELLAGERAASAPAVGEGAARTRLTALPAALVEARICALFEQITGRAGIKPQDRFFEVGGDSLGGMTLVAALRAEGGRQLPLRELYERQSPAELAEWLVPSSRAEDPPAPAAAGPARQSPLLVRLAPTPESGPDPRPAVFCFHAVPGTVAEYVALGLLLPEFRLIALQARGLLAGRQPETDLEALVEAGAAAVAAEAGSGPYRLLGIGAGGAIALEVLRRLRPQPDPSDLLALIDSDPPPEGAGDLPATFEAFTLRGLGLGPAPARALAAMVRLAPRRVRTAALHRMLGRQLAAAPRLPGIPEVTPAFVESLVRVAEAQLSMLRTQWRPEPYEGRALLVTPAGDRRQRAASEPRWRALLPRLRVATVPGTRRTIGANIPQREAALLLREALAGADSTPDRGYSPLLPLQPVGTLPPLFCVHPLIGRALVFATLAGALRPDVPVWGIEARGGEPGESVFASMDEMAAAYLAAMRTVQPSGPYHLAGHSVGGLIAHDLACRLEAAGEQVGTIAMFDSLLPESFPRGWVAEPHDIVRAISKTVGLPHDQRVEADEATVSRLLAALIEAGHLPAGTGVDWLAARIEAGVLAARATFAICAGHRPARCRAPIVMFRAVEETEFPGDEAFDWTPYTAGGVTRIDLPANHNRILEPRMATIAAAALRGRMMPAQEPCQREAAE